MHQKPPKAVETDDDQATRKFEVSDLLLSAAPFNEIERSSTILAADEPEN